MSYQFIIELKERVSAPAKQMKQSLDAVVDKVDMLKTKMDSLKGVTGAISKMKKTLEVYLL